MSWYGRSLGKNMGSTTASATGLKKRILVLDDEKMVRKVLVRMLSSFGHHVSAVSGGLEAFRAFQQDGGVQIDLLVTDVSLRGEDGRTIAAELRRRNPDLRVLFVSGSLAPDLVPLARRAAEHLTEVRYLSKPFSGSDLRGAVTDLLKS